MRLKAVCFWRKFKFSVVYLLYITCYNSDVFATSSDSKIYYKVSMVAADEKPGLPALFRNGESPVWDSHNQRLLLVDIPAQNVHRLDYNTGRIDVKHIEFGPVNVVMTVAKSNRLLVCVRASVFLLDWDVEGESALRPLTSLDLGSPDNIINEGKVDAGGRLWAATMGLQTEDNIVRDRGTLYSISSRQPMSPRIHVRPITKINGLAWALNGSLMYFTDAGTRKVEAFNFDCDRGLLKISVGAGEAAGEHSLQQPHLSCAETARSIHTLLTPINSAEIVPTPCQILKIMLYGFRSYKGTLMRLLESTCSLESSLLVLHNGHRRTIIDISEYGYDEAVPAGITVDSVGNLWVALMYGGTVLHINPNSRHVIYGYKLPVSRTSGVAWGGPNLDELFVTTSQLNVDSEAEPLAGAIFTIRDTGSSGIVLHSFLLENADHY